MTSRFATPSPSRSRWTLAALWASLALVLVVFRAVLLPFAIALVIAYLLEPLVTRLSRLRLGAGRHLPRWGAVIGLYVVFFALLYVFALTVIPKLYSEIAGLSKAGMRFFNDLTPERIARVSEQVEMWLLSRGIPVELSPADPAGAGAGYGLSLDLEHALRQGLARLSEGMRAHFLDAISVVQKIVQGVLGFVFSFFFILMVAAFMLIDWSRLGRFFLGLVPPERHGDYQQIMAAIDSKLAGVVRGQAIICLVNGVLTAIGLVVLGVPFVFVLSLIATVLSAIPIFGSILSSVPIVLIAITRGFDTALAMLGWIVGIHALEAYLLNPKIMGAQAHIHPVLVAFALLAGEVTYGFTGALFAVPVAGVLAAIFTCAHERALRRLPVTDAAAVALPLVAGEPPAPPAAG